MKSTCEGNAPRTVSSLVLDGRVLVRIGHQAERSLSACSVFQKTVAEGGGSPGEFATILSIRQTRQRFPERRDIELDAHDEKRPLVRFVRAARQRLDPPELPHGHCAPLSLGARKPQSTTSNGLRFSIA